MDVGILLIFQNFMGRSEDAEMVDSEIRLAVLAEELGFDAVALNEHHGNPFCMGSVMNVEASILARITTRVRIVLIGNPLPVIKHPLRMAEELAETIGLPLDDGANSCPDVDRHRCKKQGGGLSG